jgi:hypothetical protein
MTPPDTPEEELELEGVGLVLAVELADAGTLEESRTLSALKYSNWSGLVMKVGSNLPTGHVELFSHGLALQHPQKVGSDKQVQKSVVPAQVPPGYLLYILVDTPAGRSLSPKQPFWHGSSMQQPI